jgi:hypothetical protein
MYELRVGHVAGMGWKRKGCGGLIGNRVRNVYLKEISLDRE